MAAGGKTCGLRQVLMWLKSGISTWRLRWVFGWNAYFCRYLTAVIFGMVDFTAVPKNDGRTVLKCNMEKFSSTARLTMLPALWVILSEHTSHRIVTGSIIGRDLLRDSGLKRSIFPDNFSTALSGLFGGAPITTYEGNIGAMAMPRVCSVQ